MTLSLSPLSAQLGLHFTSHKRPMYTKLNPTTLESLLQTSSQLNTLVVKPAQQSGVTTTLVKRPEDKGYILSRSSVTTGEQAVYYFDAKGRETDAEMYYITPPVSRIPKPLPVTPVHFLLADIGYDPKQATTFAL